APDTRRQTLRPPRGRGPDLPAGKRRTGQPGTIPLNRAGDDQPASPEGAYKPKKPVNLGRGDRAPVPHIAYALPQIRGPCGYASHSSGKALACSRWYAALADRARSSSS